MRPSSLRLLCGLALFAVACSAPQLPEPLADTGRAKRCLLLTTNDGEAHFDGPRLGPDLTSPYLMPVARVAGEKLRLAALYPGRVLLVNSGDDLQGRYMEREDGNRALAAQLAWQIYEKAGYDLGTLGNHEFDAGPKVVRTALEGLTRYRILIANLDLAGSPLDPTTTTAGPDGKLLEEARIVDCGGIRVGFFGLLTPSTRTISDFGDMRFANGEGPVNGPARRIVEKLRADGAQIVVALTHLGLDDDQQLAGAVDGIDAILGGHSHTPMTHWRKVGPTVIVQSGSRFSHLGYLELVLAANGQGLDHARTTWTLKPMTTALPLSQPVADAVDELRKTLIPERVVGVRKVAWDVTGGDKTGYGQRAARATAQFAAKATQRPVHGALLNAGGFRSATVYPPGPVTNVDVQAIHPFRNHLVLVTLTGEQLRDVMEHACSSGRNDKHGSRAVLWNLTLRCDPDKPVARYDYKDNRPVRIVERGQRVAELMIEGKPLDAKAKYTLATLDYLARGGSSYLSLREGERKCLDGKDFDDKIGCPGSPLLATVIEAAVVDGSLDQPL